MGKRKQNQTWGIVNCIIGLTRLIVELAKWLW